MARHFVVFMLMFGAVYAQMDLTAVKTAYDACALENGVTEDFESVHKKVSIPITHVGQCMLECILKKMGLHKLEGGYSHDGTKVFFTRALAPHAVNDPGIVDKAMAIADDCAKSDVAGLDHCEGASKLYQCTVNKFKEQNIPLKKKKPEE